MPFIGKDWRSPGYKWIKLDKGWEQIKLLEGFRTRTISSTDQDECIKINNYNCSLPSSPSTTQDIDLLFNNISSEFSLPNKSRDFSKSDQCEYISGKLDNSTITNSLMPLLYKPPYVFNGERKYSSPRGFTSLKEAFTKLDFLNGINDIQRFNYITKVLSLLVKEKLPTLSGSGRKCVFTLANHVITNGLAENRNFGLIRTLLRDLHTAIKRDCTFGRRIGSDRLWFDHVTDFEEWTALVMETNYVTTRQPPKLLQFQEAQLLQDAETLPIFGDFSSQAIPSNEMIINNLMMHLNSSPQHSDSAFIASQNSFRDGLNDVKIPQTPQTPILVRNKVLTDLPRECVFKIVSCLSDHRDLINLSQIVKEESDPITLVNESDNLSAKPSPPPTTTTNQINILRVVFDSDKPGFSNDSFNACPSLFPEQVTPCDILSVASEFSLDSLVWRKLCTFHFTEQQISRRLSATTASSTTKKLSCAVEKFETNLGDNFIDWQDMYFKLKRYYGVKEIYANMLHFCLGCKCIFWKGLGHPCAYNPRGDKPQPTVRIYPHEFIEIVLY